MPVELENLAMTVVEGLLKCGAFDNAFAVSVGWKLPFRRTPLACTDRLRVSVMLRLEMIPCDSYMHLTYRVGVLEESQRYLSLC